jgi:hypothetical protein
MRREWQQCRKEKNEEEFSSAENIGATSGKPWRHRIVTNAEIKACYNHKFHCVLS